MGWNVNDLTLRAGAPLGVGSPAAYLFGGNTQHVVYQGFSPAQGNDGHLYELYWDQDSGSWHHKDLTLEAEAPLATESPTAYAFEATGSQHVLYEGQFFDGHVHELWWDSDGWHHNDLTDVTDAPLSAGVATGYEFAGDATQNVVYQSRDRHINVLRWDGNWHHADLTVETAAPLAVIGASPSAYAFRAEQTQHVIYRGVDNHVHELWWKSNRWHHNDLTLRTGAPEAAAGPSGYVFDGQGTQHVDYYGRDHHLHELWADSQGWHHYDLTAAGAPPPDAVFRPTGYGFDAQIAEPVATQHVDYVGTDGHINEMWWDTGGWHHSDLTTATGAPPTISSPAAYMFPAQGTQHVMYNGADSHHIIELSWKHA